MPPYELIALDNSDRLFRSASIALNYGGSKAKGRYLLFAHQDIVLSDERFLEKAERLLDSLPEVGIAGVAGVNEMVIVDTGSEERTKDRIAYIMTTRNYFYVKPLRVGRPFL